MLFNANQQCFQPDEYQLLCSSSDFTRECPRSTGVLVGRNVHFSTPRQGNAGWSALAFQDIRWVRPAVQQGLRCKPRPRDSRTLELFRQISWSSSRRAIGDLRTPCPVRLDASDSIVLRWRPSMPQITKLPNCESHPLA